MMKITATDYELKMIYATQYIYEFRHSANSPILVRGIDKVSGQKDDFVVKLRAAERMADHIINTYQYQVLRYLPDKVSGEFINLGLVIYDPKTGDLAQSYYKKTARLHAFFPSVNARYIVRIIKFIESGINRLANDLSKPISFDRYASLDEITRQVLPKDDSALMFTDASSVLDLDIGSVVSDLFNRMVCNYINESDHETLLDQEVWTRMYKSHFDKLELTRQLKAHTVKTKHDEWKFEKNSAERSVALF